MKKYIIDSFCNLINPVNVKPLYIYKLKNRHKRYELNINPTTWVVPEVFFGNSSFMVYSVKSRVTPNKQFTLGDEIDFNGKSILIRFEFTQDKLILRLDNGRYVNFDEAKHFKEIEVSEEMKKIEPNFYIIRKKIEDSFKDKDIRIERLVRKRKETPKKFLIKFFEEWNQEDSESVKDTIYVKTKEVQTLAGKRRSLADIYMIMKYYYQDITLQEVVNLLYVELPVHFESGFRTMICSQIKKRVWHYVDGKENVSQHFDQQDEWGHKVEYYNTKFKQSKPQPAGIV